MRHLLTAFHPIGGGYACFHVVNADFAVLTFDKLSFCECRPNREPFFKPLDIVFVPLLASVLRFVDFAVFAQHFVAVDLVFIADLAACAIALEYVVAVNFIGAGFRHEVFAAVLTAF